MGRIFRSWNEPKQLFYYFKNGKYFINSKCTIADTYWDINFNWDNAEQFTGMFDKNGVKIFEGDKIKDKHTDKVYFVKYNLLHASYHLFNDNGYCRDLTSNPYNEWRLDDYEVIGTIHDKDTV